MSHRIGIVGAMEREVGVLLKEWRRGTMRSGANVFGVWRSEFATYIASGIGRVPAALATRALVEGDRPAILISAGFAGALTRSLSVGQTIIPGTVIDSQTEESFPVQGGTGVLVSTLAIADEDAKRELGERFRAEAVDMEAAAVARVAQEKGVSFCALKAISDELGFAMPPFNAYVTAEGKLAIERFAAHVAFRPSYWSSLVHLARNSRRASVELSAALAHLISILSRNSVTALEQALDGLAAGATPVN
jgi:adenosylhomocysteine nucleosidase